jgi:hypothetical protein
MKEMWSEVRLSVGEEKGGEKNKGEKQKKRKK